ncbi:MAG: urate hydroxylase PuuD [Alphaproteobacteria bacterium]|nr:urate hydroxylase PuuD [Alphaproteobacteria bacterium]
MKQPLESLHMTVILGLILTLVMAYVVAGTGYSSAMDLYQLPVIVRWLHVVSGVMWIGLLWYFNFVQIPNMPNIPDDQKPAIGKVIAPAALFWFRWGAMGTIVFGLYLAELNGYLADAMMLSGGPNTVGIGIGMWLGLIMWFNVWFVIWPNQKKALGIVEADADAKKAAARTAMLFSRTNTLLSFPMLLAMVSAQNI